MRIRQNPWEKAETPHSGDHSAEIVFKSIGHALTCWELMEMEFAGLFSIVVSDAPGSHSIAAKRAYGSVLTFRGRSDMLKSAFEAFINESMRYNPPSDLAGVEKLQSDFKDLHKLANHLSGRRNEIAHGYVREWIDGCGDSVGFALFPSTYSTNKNTLAAPDEAQYMRHYPWPDYIYASGEINDYANQFSDVAKGADPLLHAFLNFKHRR
jgi:hypothetical protein